MKQLLILSGKGGTGKTTIASAFIKLSNAKACADCDVDAPNLHLVMNQKNEPKKSDFYGLDKAEIDQELCIQCDLCRQNCRFDAVKINNDLNLDIGYNKREPEKNAQYVIDYYGCEGCGVCQYVCPVNAITLKPAVSGELMLYIDNENKVFSTAQLKMGSGNSGLLVTDVKKQMKNFSQNAELAIIDGSPGIGCPVIASISGVDMILIVAEPSLSGISDMERIIRTAESFQMKIAVCINKHDTNLENTERIKTFCNQNNISFVGEIPFDKDAITVTNDGKTIVDIECTSGNATKIVFKNTMEILFGKNK